MYFEATVRDIERHYEREIAELRRSKATIATIVREMPNHNHEVLQVVDVRETPDGLYVKVR